MRVPSWSRMIMNICGQAAGGRGRAEDNGAFVAQCPFPITRLNRVRQSAPGPIIAGAEWTSFLYDAIVVFGNLTWTSQSVWPEYIFMRLLVQTALKWHRWCMTKRILMGSQKKESSNADFKGKYFHTRLMQKRRYKNNKTKSYSNRPELIEVWY